MSAMSDEEHVHCEQNSETDATGDEEDVECEENSETDATGGKEDVECEENSETDATGGKEDVECEENSENAAFSVIGREKKLEKKPLKVPLPVWFLNAVTFEDKVKKTEEEEYSLECLEPFLDDILIEKLRVKGIKRYFPVQKAVIPHLVKSLQSSHLWRSRDICVSSPTGSGKTLAFVLPSVQYLLNRVETHIRVLVVLPVRDLALQVFQVFEEFCKGTTLKVGIAVGRRLLKEDIDRLLRQTVTGGYKSVVDILIATPGRLVDLIERAPGFSLKKLKILILDEADRTMNNEMESSFLLELEKAIYGTDQGSCVPCFCGLDSNVISQKYSVECSCPCSLSHYSSSAQPPLKLLFSATISSDPEKIETFRLFQPILFQAVSFDSNATSADFADFANLVTPTKLKEKMIIVEEDTKPNVVWYLIEELGYRKVIVFTKSVESAKRLCLLLKKIKGINVAEFSSNLKDTVREEELKKFSDGKIDVLVCSDILARGMDIEGTKYVICYDAPSNETAYVHRIGRTARAGKKGYSITLITRSQIGSFQRIIRKIHKGSFKKNVSLMKIKKNALKKTLPKYTAALKSLKKRVLVEKVNEKAKKKMLVNSIE